MSETELKTEIRHLIESESDIEVLKTVRNMLSGSTRQEKLISRALKSEEDISQQKLLSRKDLEERLQRVDL